MKRFLLLACAVYVAAACGEDLDGGSACPALCPEQRLPIQEVVLDAIALDTTVGTYPLLGQEPGLLLASRGDTLDVRGVARYDSLAKTFLENGVEKQVTAVDSARLFLRIDTSAVNFQGDITLQVFDVDTTAADSNTAAVVALFRPDRLIASVVINRGTLFLDDTLNVPISNQFVLDKIKGPGRVRVGFQFVGQGDLTLRSVESGLPVALKYDPAPGNTSVASRATGPLSNTPSTEPLFANDLRDYSIVVVSPPSLNERLVAGGLPATRVYFRFNIPAYYLDSVTVVRAQLVLVQKPIHGFAEADLASVYPVAASTTQPVTDIRRAALLVYPAFSFGLGGIVQAPRDSGERRIDMVQLFRQWSASFDAKRQPVTALVLRGANEGRAPGRLAFFGLNAPSSVRPRLHLSFVARSRFGVP